MMRIKDPLLFDYVAFWESEQVEMMTGEQVGAYLRLLCRQWAEGYVPASAERIAAALTSGARIYTVEDLVGRTGSLEAPEEGSIWHGIGGCFEPTKGGLSHPSRVGSEKTHAWLQNPRLAEEREAWILKKEGWKEAGRRGGRRSGESRRKSRKPKKGKPLRDSPKGGLSHPEATLKPPFNPPLKGGSTPISDIHVGDKDSKGTPPTPPRGAPARTPERGGGSVSEQEQDEQIERIFDAHDEGIAALRRVRGEPFRQWKRTPERRRLIAKGLRSFDEDLLAAAARYLPFSPHHRGVNPSRAEFLDLRYALKEPERFYRLYTGPPAEFEAALRAEIRITSDSGGPGSLAAAQQRALDEIERQAHTFGEDGLGGDDDEVR